MSVGSSSAMKQNVMDKGHQEASPVVGLTSNIPAKLKSTNSFTDSPNSNSCNACNSPSQPAITSTNKTMSPFTPFNAETKPDDMVLPKNGTKLMHGPSTSPFFPNENSPAYPNSTSPSVTTSSSSWLHGNSNSKRTYNKFSGGSSPSDAMPASRTVNRTDKTFAKSEQASHGMLSRSRSVNSNIGQGNPNNVNPNIARRMCSVDSNHNKDSATSRNATNAVKFSDKVRHSPRTNYVHEGRSQSESPFGTGPPASFESALPGNSSKSKPRSESSSTPNMRLNHLMSRTSSSNSISDLSPCSAEENTSKLNKTSSLALESSLPSSATFTPVCNNTSDAINDLSIENNLLSLDDDDINIDSLQNEQLDLDDFDFPGSGNDRDDIGSNALKLNLSAEDVQQTLNSVSADQPLPDISMGCASTDNNPTSSDADNRSQTDLLSENIELRDILTTTSSSVTTLPTSSVETTSSKLIPTSLDPITGAFSDICSTSNTALTTTTTTSYPSPALSSGPTKSHLQEILGAADTNRLKNMARPIDPSQYSSPSSASFTSDFSNQNKSFIGQNLPTSTDRPPQQLHVTSPSGVSTRHKYPTGSGPPFPPRMLHRTASTPHQMPSLHNYDMNPTPFDHPGKFPPDHGMPMGPRSAMPFDQPNLPHSMHDGGPYGLSSPQGNWQRSHSSSGLMGPHVGHPGLSDGSRSPRGFGPNFPSKPINPMSGLQSTVDAIPNLSMITKNNNNNMGPPQSSQRIPTPGMGEASISGPLSIDSRTMLPPPSPLTHDKRSVSADGSVTVPGLPKTKGNKRERGLSLDSKDGDKKEPGAKKRRKSKSKDETRKADLRVSQRLGHPSDLQATCYYVFNTEMANAAASLVGNGSVQSIIHHHTNVQANCRLLPSKSPIHTSNQQTSIKTELNSPHSALTSSASAPPSVKPEIKSLPHSVPASTTPSQGVKTENPNSIPSAGSQVKSDTKPGNAVNRIKGETEADAARNSTGANHSPSTELAKKEENLTDEQRKHREESLTKLERLKSQFITKSSVSSSNNPESWPVSTSQNNHYRMTRYLQKVQETNKDNSPAESWLTLVQAYNEEKRRNRHMMSNPIDNVPSEPPPYSPAGPPHMNQRWVHSGHPIREHVLSPELSNSRFPHHGVPGPIRIPHDGARFPASYGPSRFPRNYIPSGPSRMSMYSVPPGMIPRSSIPRLPSSHGMVPSNEAYPFSEKLKEQASMYRSEGMHNQPGPMGFDINTGDPMVGPRMGSPDWPPYANAHNQVPLNRGLGSIPSEVLSPNCSGIGSASINPNSMPGQVMEPCVAPSGDTAMDINMAMQMNNPGIGPSFGMTSYASKGPGGLPTYPTASMAGKSYPSEEMRPSTNPSLDGAAGMMGDTMARRGEPRPPDLNINPSMTRSPPNFQGSRHPMHSPGMMPSQYVGGEPGGFPHGGLPHMSPHPSNIPRSPMVNSPSLMKSPMGGMRLNKMSYGGMAPMDQPGIMQAGRRSAGPAGGLPADWNGMPQPASGPPSRMPHNAIPNNPNHKPAIQQMIDGVNRFQLPNALYQNEVKESVSPQSLSHMVDNPGMNQDTSSLSQSRIEGPITPGAGPMLRHPGFDSGPRSAGPRMIGPMMGESFGPEFTRPPSHPEMCMSPVQGGTPGQGMGQPAMMDTMHGGPGLQPSMLPSSDATVSGGMPGHPNQPQSVQRFPSEFDLSGILPSEKPTETLSYFPSGGANTQDTSQMIPNPNMSMAMRSPSMTQQPVNRYPSMVQRPMTPGASYAGNNSGIRMPGPGNFMGSNPPGYPASAGEGYMSPSWEGVPRPQMMPNNGPNMHPNFQRPLI